MLPYVKRSAGVRCLYIEHSVVAIVRLALVSGSHGAGPMHNLHRCQHGHWAITGGGWGKRLTDNHKAGDRSVTLLKYSLAEVTL